METVIEGNNKIVHISADWMGHELDLSLEVPHWHAKLTRDSLMTEADLSATLPASAPPSRIPSPERPPACASSAADKPPPPADDADDRNATPASPAKAAKAAKAEETPVSRYIYHELLLYRAQCTSKWSCLAAAGGAPRVGQPGWASVCGHTPASPVLPLERAGRMHKEESFRP